MSKLRWFGEFVRFTEKNKDDEKSDVLENSADLVKFDESEKVDKYGKRRELEKSNDLVKRIFFWKNSGHWKFNRSELP